MTRHPSLIVRSFLLGALPLLMGSSPSASPVPVAGPALSAETITGNPYWRRAIQASTQLMSVLTVTVPVDGGDLAEEINQANLGFAMAGWTLVAQGSVENQGTTTKILLTYRKAN